MAILFKISYYLFVSALVVIGVLLVGTLFPIPGNFEVKIVQSGSMEPSIRIGSVVIVRPSSAYKVGDIVTFGEDTKTKVPITHRIVGEEVVGGAFLYTTKGDANDDPDTRKVPEDEIIGKVLFSIPYAGFVIDMARKPVGFVLLVGIPAAAIIIDELVTIWKEIARMRGKNKKSPVSSGASGSPDKKSKDTNTLSFTSVLRGSSTQKKKYVQTLDLREHHAKKNNQS